MALRRLAPELIEEIASYLDSFQLGPVVRTCRYFQQVCQPALHSRVHCRSSKRLAMYLDMVAEYPERLLQLTGMEIEEDDGSTHLIYNLIELPLPKLKTLIIHMDFCNHNLDRERYNTLFERIAGLPGLEEFEMYHPSLSLRPYWIEVTELQVVRNPSLRRFVVGRLQFNVRTRPIEDRDPQFWSNKQKTGPLEVQLVECTYGLKDLKYLFKMAPKVQSVSIRHSKRTTFATLQRTASDYIIALSLLSRSLTSLEVLDPGRYSTYPLNFSAFPSLKYLRTMGTWLVGRNRVAAACLPPSIEVLAVDADAARSDSRRSRRRHRDRISFELMQELMQMKPASLPQLRELRLYHTCRPEPIWTATYLPKLESLADDLDIKFTGKQRPRQVLEEGRWELLHSES